MHPLLVRQLAADFCVSKAEVLDHQHHFSTFTPHPERRQYMEIRPCLLKIAVTGGKLLFTGREDIVDRCRTLDAPVQCRYAIGCFRVCTTLALRRFSLLAFPNVTCPVSAFWKKCCNRHFFPEINVDVDTFSSFYEFPHRVPQPAGCTMSAVHDSQQDIGGAIAAAGVTI